jgi:hypothetical protein
MYNEFNQLNTVPDEGQSDLQQLQRETLDIMKGNQSIIREMTRENRSNVECSMCCRKFVHENGLYRHWDMHIGELLAESRSSSENDLQPVALCVFCGEVFSNDTLAWDHLARNHIYVDSEITHTKVPMELDSENFALEANNNAVEVSSRVSQHICTFVKHFQTRKHP